MRSELEKIAQELRLTVLKMNHKAGSGHTGGSFSCAEITTVLYEKFMNVDAKNPKLETRDRFILSKGHAAPSLYATLARKGFFEEKELETLRQTGSILQGHPCMSKCPGVDMSMGSLGLGVSVGVGMALTARTKGENWRTYVVCGDGELDEGQNWEAFASISKWNLSNLTVIIDKNNVQLDGTKEEIMPMNDLKGKLNGFGLKVMECNGHNCEDLEKTIKIANEDRNAVVIIANTVKGKGVSFMEGEAAWHGKPINEEDYANAKIELVETLNNL